jgi:hypothetical protein
MNSFQASLEIAAPARRVWDLLCDTANWTRWNTTVDKVEGNVALGSTVKVFAKISPGRAFPVKVVELVPERRMVWSSGMPLGLFKGTRTFELNPTTAGSLSFTMREQFTGLLAPLITRSIPDLTPTFDEFAACLKSAAERAER